MAHETQGMRLSGDLYLFRIVGGVEQRGLGPLPADVLSMQPNVEKIEVKDKRRNKRGQLLYSIPDPQSTTGKLTLLSVPPRALAMIMLGDVVQRNDTGGTVTSQSVSVEPDYWTALGKPNVSAVTVDTGVKASLATGTEVSNNAITWTAVTPGTDGNSITVALVDPSANSAALAVSVTGTAISVSLATDGTGTITSTAAEVIAAIEGDEDASALVTVADTGTSTGVGVVAEAAAANLTSGAASGGTTLTLDTDYELDGKLGLIRAIEGGAITASTTVFVSYTYSAVTGDRLRVGTSQTVRARLLLRGVNDIDDTALEWEAYSALITPAGELDLMGDEPMQAEFELSFETPSDKDMPIRMDWPTYA